MYFTAGQGAWAFDLASMSIHAHIYLIHAPHARTLHVIVFALYSICLISVFRLSLEPLAHSLSKFFFTTETVIDLLLLHYVTSISFTVFDYFIYIFFHISDNTCLRLRLRLIHMCCTMAHCIGTLARFRNSTIRMEIYYSR